MCEFLSGLWVVETLGVAVGIVLSYIAEYLKGYQNLAPKWKRLVFFGVCLALPFAGLGFAHLAGCPAVSWQEALMAGLAAFAAGTAMHTRAL